jgi:hypothetical protein
MPAESDSGGIGCLHEDALDELPVRNTKLVTTGVIPADSPQPAETASRPDENFKCACKLRAIELFVVVLTGDLPPTLPVRRRLDEPHSQMSIARITTIRTDCVLSRHNPPLIEISAHPIVPGVQNVLFFLAAIT